MNPSPKSLSNFVSKFEKRREQLKSLLCIGLDPEWEKLPNICRSDASPLFHFCKTIVSATHPYATSWKPNIAFFERFGSKGLLEFENYVSYAKEICLEVPIVADAKRGDLANTSKEYAKYYFQSLGVDALTVNAYMGEDSLLPYLDLGGFIFVLGLTSNPSSQDFQKLKTLESGRFIYEEMAEQMSRLEERYPAQVGLVVGGTHPNELLNLRKEHPNLYFLIPGFGAQGGDLASIFLASGKKSLINSSRGITLTSINDDFGEISKKKAEEIHKEMNVQFDLNV